MFTHDINLSDKSKPAYIKLACNDKVILFIGDHLDESMGPEANTSSAYSVSSLTTGILGLALALFCDHKSHHMGEIGDPWPDIIKDENNYYVGYPLFIPICSFGCCGGCDFGIFIRDKVKIVTYDNEEFFISPEEYVDMIIHCLNEMYKLANIDKSEWSSFWLLLFLLSRAALEGREEIRKPLIRKLIQFSGENGICI